MNGLLSLLGLRTAGDDEYIRALRLAWPEFDCEWHKGTWRAYRLDGTGEPVSGRTPRKLAAAIAEAWVAAGAPR